MHLTESGQQLFDEILPAVNIILEAEKKFSLNRNINFGTYATMLSKVLGDCIANFYEKNKCSKINAITEPFDSLFSRLQNYELDILVAKKINQSSYDPSKIKYIKLGDSEFVLIANNSSKLCNKIVKISDLKNKIIYVPRGDSASSLDFIKLLKENQINEEIKRIDSVTMCRIIENYDYIGLINKDYIRQELKENRVTVLNTNFKIKSTEFGIYIQKNNRFPELINFINILKNKFKYNK